MNSDRILLQLLSIALGNCHEGLSSKIIDWQDLMKTSDRHGVLAIAFDGIQTLPKRQLPPMNILMDWLGQVSCYESRYESYTNTVSELADLIRSQSLNMMVLKGYGCSLYYPIPKHRPCGDIDMYVLDDNFVHKSIYVKFVDQIANIQIDTTEKYVIKHHSQFLFNDLLVENHETVLDINTHKSNKVIETILESLAKESRKVMLNNSEVLLPSARFNSIHLLRHMANDFATVKMSLRQLLDWSTFVASSDIDWTFVRNVAHEANMHYFLDAINAICVEYLKYPKELFPVENINTKLRDRVLNDILHPEYSREILPPFSNMTKMAFVSYAFQKSWRMWSNRWKYRIVYKESLIQSFWWSVKKYLKSTDVLNN